MPVLISQLFYTDTVMFFYCDKATEDKTIIFTLLINLQIKASSNASIPSILSGVKLP